MAQRDDIRARLRKVDPRMRAITDEVDRQIARLGGKGGVVVTTTDDMTTEEEEMALFEGYLREGYTEDIAAQKAKHTLAFMNQFAKDNERRRNAKKKRHQGGD